MVTPTTIACAVVALGTAVVACVIFDRAPAPVQAAARAIPVRSAPSPLALLESPGPSVDHSGTRDALAAYVAMRDDVNARPRLLLIDRWASLHPDGDDSGLLGHAMVDPDESVRERAHALFERSLSRR